MTVDDYVAWARSHPGRYELVGGRPIQMAPETTGHIKVKALTWLALMDAIEAAELNLIAVSDGATVKIANDTAFEPDALVYAGPELPGSEVIVPAPLIVVEVVSPSSGSRDSGAKLRGYFSVSSLEHYLVVDPDSQTVVHHRRSAGAEIATRALGPGDSLMLDPPGLTVDTSQFFRRKL